MRKHQTKPRGSQTTYSYQWNHLVRREDKTPRVEVQACTWASFIAAYNGRHICEEVFWKSTREKQEFAWASVPIYGEWLSEQSPRTPRLLVLWTCDRGIVSLIKFDNKRVGGRFRPKCRRWIMSAFRSTALRNVHTAVLFETLCPL